MNIDLSLIPSTFDAVHAGLAATVAGLLILQILFLTVAFIAQNRKPQALPPAPQVPAPLPAPVPAPEKPAAIKPAPVEVKPVEAPAPIVQIKTETVVLREATPDAALQLLGLLQKEARFLDFTQENMGDYSDSEIGAVARVVHEGCCKVLKQNFELAPVRTEEEGKRITLAKGYDAASVRITGNIVGVAPFTGTLIHRGWKATEVKLPKITEGHDATIIAAAEVEL
ncbi:MAG: DUF2760 domain-containing protein [Candidatus Methylumidiphilus sp.]